MRKNLFDRKKELERQRIALLGKEKAIIEIERKERTRKLIELGGLIAKAGLDALDTKILYGALISLNVQKNNLETLKTWQEKGTLAFAKDSKNQDGVSLALQFKEKPIQEVRVQIRALGLRWNAIRQEWQGKCRLELAQALAEQYGGVLITLEE